MKLKLKLKIELAKNTTNNSDCEICVLNVDTCSALILSCKEGEYFKRADKKPKKKKELKLIPLNIHRFNSRETCTRCGMSRKYFEWTGSDCFDNPMVKFLPQRAKKQ